MLKNSNAKLKGRDSDGKSLLHHCVENNAQGCLALLLERKSEVFLNVRDKDGWTPLHYSALLNNIPSAQQLITAGAHLDVVTPRAENGWSALHISVWLGFEEMAELLLTRGADATQKDSAGRTAAELAEFFKRNALAEKINRFVVALTRNGSSPSTAASSTGRLPEEEANWQKVLRVLRKKDLTTGACLLESLHVDVNASVTDDGKTILHEAVLTCPPAALEFLLSCSADPNAKTKGGENASALGCRARALGLCQSAVGGRCRCEQWLYVCCHTSSRRFFQLKGP